MNDRPADSASRSSLEPAEDVARLENAAPIQGTALGWWRSDLSKAAADAYWRDVHGTLVARAPGLYSYRQLHLGRPVGDLWPRFAAAGVGTVPKPAEQIDGMNQLLFLTQQDLEAFARSDLVRRHVFHDERNLVRANATMWSAPGEARTLIDRTGDPTPQHRVTRPSYSILFRRAEGVDCETFRTHILELAEQWAGAAGVLRLRVQILGPYDPTSWQSPGVEHHWPPEHQYQAWIDLTTGSEAAARALGVEETVEAVRRLVSAVHVYPIEARYTVVWQGRPTDVGLRGWPAVETIIEAGADNQRSAELLRVVFGGAVDGGRKNES
jgi:hypothetical protein